MEDPSKNPDAERIMGLREKKIGGAIVIDLPCELVYHCPICEYEHMSPDGEHYDERLQWSEYNGFIWCEVCNFDYPSALCKTDPRAGTEVFLMTVEQVLIDAREKDEEHS